MARPKVFCIGFHKTGTKSLATALRGFGYRVTGPNGFRLKDISLRYVRICRRYSSQYDVFQDNPWPLTYREMNEMWPDAKFILTLRDPDAWLHSVKRHFGNHSTPMRELVYGRGSPVGNEAVYLDRFHQHETEVKAFFADKANRFLTLRITEGEGYEKLCPFLEEPIPDGPFPQINKANSKGTL